MLELRPTPLDHPDAAALVVLLQAHYLEIYGGHDDTPHAAAEFVPPEGYFVVGYVDGVAVACGGWRARDDDDPPLRPGDAEIKRMFVRSGAPRPRRRPCRAGRSGGRRGARRSGCGWCSRPACASPRRSASTSARATRRWRRSAPIATRDGGRYYSKSLPGVIARDDG